MGYLCLLTFQSVCAKKKKKIAAWVMNENEPFDLRMIKIGDHIKN